MIVGVVHRSLMIVLLEPHLLPHFQVQTYDTIEALTRALDSEEVQWSLLEEQTTISIQSREKRTDFLKPLKLTELLCFFESARAVSVYSLGPCVFDPRKRLLEPENKNRPSVPLREKETQLLCLLLEFLEQGVSRQKLLSEIWGIKPGIETRTLETHIYHLRQKLEDDPHNPKVLLNTSDGYTLSIGGAHE